LVAAPMEGAPKGEKRGERGKCSLVKKKSKNSGAKLKCPLPGRGRGMMYRHGPRRIVSKTRSTERSGRQKINSPYSLKFLGGLNTKGRKKDGKEQKQDKKRKSIRGLHGASSPSTKRSLTNGQHASKGGGVRNPEATLRRS